MKYLLARLTVIVLLFFCTGFSARQEQSISPQSITLNWTTVGELHLILVPLTLNADRARLFIIDTGMPDTSLDRSLAASLNLDVKTYAFDKKEKVEYITSPVTLGSPAFSLPEVPFILLDMSVTKEDYPDIAGIIGLNFLENFVLRLDFSKHQLHLILQKNASEIAPKEAERIPLQREKDKYYVNGTLDGNPIKFLIDTGAEHTFVRDRSVLDALKPQRTLEGETAAVASEAGTSLQVARIRKMRLLTLGIGKFTWENPIVDQRLSASQFDSNGLGIDFLQRFNAVIDFPGKQLYLSPNPVFSEQKDTWIGSGMILGLSSDKHWIVTTVFSPSPAKEAMIEEGDEITTLQGKQTQGLTTQQMFEIIQQTKKENAEVSGTAIRKASSIAYKFKFHTRKLL